jgi:hypothetical protein
VSKILLDYFFPITAIEPTPEASTAFLNQVCIVVTPASMVETGVVTLCTSMADVAELTDNTDAQQLFNAGMSRVYVLPMDDLNLSSVMDDEASNFFTVLISSDFDEDDVEETKATGIITIDTFANLVSGTDDIITVGGIAFTAQSGAVEEGEATFQAATDDATTAASLAAQINAHAGASALVTAEAEGAVVTLTAVGDGAAGNLVTLTYTDGDANVGAVLSGLSAGKLSGGLGLFLGIFTGVCGVWSTDDDFLEDQAVITNRCAFHSTSTNKAKNMFYSFGKFLSATAWANQQYISLPVADDIDTLGEAANLFDLKISFCISDDQYSNRLALFACGGEAIFSPYVIRNLEIDMQSAGLTYVSGNQPTYTKTNAALLEDELQKVVQDYIDDRLIESGIVEVTLRQDNFVATSDINIAQPKAMWRIEGTLRQTL